MLSISSNEQKERVDNALRCIAQFGNTYGHFFLTSTNLLGNELFACLYYRPQTKFAKVIFLQGEGRAWHMAGGHAWQRGHAWQGGNAWQESWLLQRAVRILVECILVHLMRRVNYRKKRKKNIKVSK